MASSPNVASPASPFPSFAGADEALVIEGFIKKMPKAELHVHLEGTLEPGLVRKFAERNKVDVPDAQSPHDALSVLLKEEDFYDLTYAYLTKCKKENVVITEMFFDPQAHTGRGVPFPVVIEGIKRAITKGKRELSVQASLIMCFLQDESPEWAMATLMESLPHRKYITGVGLDSEERTNPPIKFAKVFERATKEGYMTTAHCDIDQKDSIEQIQQALEVLKVDRINHGTNILEDEKLIKHVKENGIGLTTCPISNDAISSDHKGKEIKKLLKTGVLVTCNSDDPATGGYMTDNMLRLWDDGKGLSKEELLQLQVNAFHASWSPTDTQNYWLGQLEDYRWQAIG